MLTRWFGGPWHIPGSTMAVAKLSPMHLLISQCKPKPSSNTPWGRGGQNIAIDETFLTEMPFQVAHRVIFLVSTVNMGINIWNLKNWANWPNMANPSIPLLWVNHFVLKSLVPLASILKTLGRSGPPKLSKELVTSKSIGEKKHVPLEMAKNYNPLVQFAMERSTMLLKTVNHLFWLGPSIPWLC